MAQFFGLLFLGFTSLFTYSQCVLIDDFRSSDVSSWREISDISHKGQSIASFRTRTFKEGQNAVLFTLLVPCHKNASFAGIVKYVSMDISDKSRIALKIRSAGSYKGYELVLRHNGESGDAVPSYVIYFEAPENDFEEVQLPIDDFRAYRRGQQISNAQPLNRKNVTSIGILAYGGLHRREKQSGVAALEIESIRID